MTTEARLDVLLVEDNPGDVRLIEEMLADAEELIERVEVGESSIEGLKLHHESDLTAGLERIGQADVDVILLDLGLPESTGLETLSAVTEATEFVPIVVLTGLDDEGVGISAIERGAQDYLVKGEVTGDLLVRSIQYAIERNRQARERERRRRHLEALNRLNRIAHGVTHDVIATSTREELEEAVCARLVEPNAFAFAWLGEADRQRGEITPRASAGAGDGYLDEVTVSIGADATDHPAAIAAETLDVQIVGDLDVADGAWREPALDRGFRSGAAIPLYHEELLYGVVTVYADSEIFTEDSRELLASLGEVVGHAITAIDRKEALVGDSLLELEFETETIARELLDLTADGGTLTLDHFVAAGDTLLAYGQAVGVPRDALTTAVEHADGVDDVRLLTAGTEEYELELTMTALGGLSRAAATHGGRIASATAAEGALRFVVEFPVGRDRRQLVALVSEECPGATNVAQRTVDRSTADVADFSAVFDERLTEKQRTALESAFFAGLFDWPRKSTGQEVAEQLGVSAPTFNQHLRAAEEAFFDAVFADRDEDHRN